MQLRVVDMFAGAGGFSLGFHEWFRDHFDGVALEIDRFALETFRANISDVKTYCSDISTLNSSQIRRICGSTDVIVASPPCQGFSVAGPAQYGKVDARNSLILQVPRYAALLRPKLCIIENVRGILTGRINGERRAFDALHDAFKSIGFYVEALLLNALDFGIPQHRERAFIFASEDKWLLDRIVRGIRYDRGMRPSVLDAISDLPLCHSGEAVPDYSSYATVAQNPYQRRLRQRSPGVLNHVAMRHTPRVIERFKRIPVGGSLKDAPAEHGQRRRNSDQIDARQRFKMNNQRLHPNEPSLAVAASFQSNFIHPFLHRNLTAREAARLQSFPDRFVLKGPRTLMSSTLLRRENRLDELGLSQFNQVGNAVPPFISRAIARAVRDVIAS